MSNKIRYLLIAAGFVVFALLAPAIILYVRGISYDFGTGGFVSTGILATRAQPSNAEIFLNGKLKRTTSGDIRFLVPGEYQITLKKSGYQDWSKRLPVNSGQVTWTNGSNSSVYLLLARPRAQVLDGGVLDFNGQNGGVAYLTANDFVIYQGGQKHNYVLPQSVDTILASDSGNKNFVLASSGTTSVATILTFNSGLGTFNNLTGLFTSTPQVQYDSGQLYALSAGTLYAVDAANKTKSPVFNNVGAFYFEAGNLYFIQQAPQSAPKLFVTQYPFAQTEQLGDSLPAFGNGQIFATFEKQIFLLLDDNLYLAGPSGPQLLAAGVSQSRFNAETSILSVLHSGEFDYYDPLSASLNFVTRDSQQLYGLTVNTSIGYAFFEKNNQIQAIELDIRDSQNQYVLYQGADIKKFILDAKGKTMTVLDSGQLKTLPIR